MSSSYIKELFLGKIAYFSPFPSVCKFFVWLPESFLLVCLIPYLLQMDFINFLQFLVAGSNKKKQTTGFWSIIIALVVSSKKGSKIPKLGPKRLEVGSKGLLISGNTTE